MSLDLKYCNKLRPDTLYLNFHASPQHESYTYHTISKLTYRYRKIKKVIAIIDSIKRKSQEKPEPLNITPEKAHQVLDAS
jgi:hypothetical protein